MVDNMLGEIERSWMKICTYTTKRSRVSKTEFSAVEKQTRVCICIFLSFPAFCCLARHKMQAKNEDMTRFTDLSLNHFTSIKIIDSNENQFGERELEQKALQTTIKRHYDSILCSFSVRITRSKRQFIERMRV